MQYSFLTLMELSLKSRIIEITSFSHGLKSLAFYDCVKLLRKIRFVLDVFVVLCKELSLSNAPTENRTRDSSVTGMCFKPLNY